MVVLNVYSRNIKVKYKTSLLSKATFVVFVGGAMSIVLPFVISYQCGALATIMCVAIYRPRVENRAFPPADTLTFDAKRSIIIYLGFWQKRDVIYEQPDVRFRGEYLLIATTTDDNHSPVICSSIPYYSKFFEFLDACPVIKVRESDQNQDGKIDSLHVMLNVKVAQNKKLAVLYFVLPLDYKLTVPCSFQMQSAIIYQQMIYPSTSKLSIFADLELEQMEPLACPASDITTTYKTNIIGEEKDVKSYELDKIIKTYSERNIKTSLKNVITTFNPTSDGTYTISLNVRYPEHKIYYKPRFWQVLKFAWVQYLSLYVVISCIIFQIKKYIFDNNLVLLYKDRTDTNK